MLIPFNKTLETCGFVPKAILHVGAWDGIEMEDYAAAWVTTVTFIEAQASIFPTLLGRIAPYPNATALNFCVSNKKEVVNFTVASNGQSSSTLMPGTHSDLYPGITFSEPIQMQAYPLMEILPPNGMVYDFVNIDIQGAELKAIQGMSFSQMANVKAFYLEVNQAETYKGCARVEEVDDYLSGYGFTRVLTGDWIDNSWTDALYLRK